MSSFPLCFPGTKTHALPAHGRLRFPEKKRIKRRCWRRAKITATLSYLNSYTATQWLFSGALQTLPRVPKPQQAAAMSCSRFAGRRYKNFGISPPFFSHHQTLSSKLKQRQAERMRAALAWSLKIKIHFAPPHVCLFCLSKTHSLSPM
jgi:hypothetical protein